MRTKGRIVCSALVIGLALGSNSRAGRVPSCEESNPVTTINTLAKGGSASNNAIVSTDVTGYIVGATDLGATASRIPVCSGTDVTTVTTDASGTATVATGSSGVSCGAGPNCVIAAINVTQKYTVRSADGADTDALAFVPQ